MPAPGPDSLLQRALQAARSMHNAQALWLLTRLSSISHVAWNEAIDTACIVRTGSQYRIEFSPHFAARYLTDDDSVLFVLLHELLHRLHGDFHRGLDLSDPRRRQMANIVTDMHINASLYETFFPQGCSLMSAMYCSETLVSQLLLPPLDTHRRHPHLLRRIHHHVGNSEGARVHFHDAVTFAPRFAQLGVAQEHCLRAARGYLATWLCNGTVAKCLELFEPLLPYLPEEPILTLGNHDERVDDLPPDLRDALERITGICGGSGGTEQEKNIRLSAQRVSPRLMQHIMRALDPDSRNPRQTWTSQPTVSVIPSAGRREAYMLASGMWPTFFPATTVARGADEQRVHIYIDVSGSASEYLPVLYAMVRQLYEFVGEPVYCFSNTIAECSLQQIEDGTVRTTGGTDFNCILEHATRHRFRRVFIVTDGQAELSEHWRSVIAARDIAIYTLFFGTRIPRNCPLLEVGRDKWQLKDYVYDTTA